MDAVEPEVSSLKPYLQRQMLGGDRFYNLSRWGVLALLLGLSQLISGEPLWPSAASQNPITLVIWGYLAFAVLATIALFIPRLVPLLRFSFAVDLLVFILLTLLNPDPRDVLYPLFLLPLVNAAFRLHSSASLLTGLMTAIAYMAAYLVARIGPDNGSIPDDPLGYVGLLLRAIVLVFIPWITGGLAERWSASNRLSVALAEEKANQALREANAYRDQTRGLYEVAYTLATTHNYQNVLEVALAESQKLAPYTCGIVLLSTGHPDELFVAASRGLDEVDRTKTISISRGALGQALRSPDPMRINDVHREPELAELTSLQRCQTACLLPLRSGLNTYGVMLFASEQSGAFGNEDVGKLAALASYALVALQNAQLIFDLQQERTKLLSKEEEVRHQLARDLHDGPAQALAAITMNVEFIKRLLERDPGRVLPELDKLGQLAKRTTHEVRTMLFELRPLALETQGLDVTLQQYLERFQGNATDIILEAEGITAQLDTKVEGTLFNIIQEAINNALKHARAKHIWVRLRQTPTTLETIVEDDGRGFDLQKVRASYEKRGSFGLMNIEERASLMGGVAEVSSEPGKGTVWKVIVPLR
ncbi:MAG: GAF domain-containing sensor histidine kinase [Chloroflexi bacterium]|nr:GAF domain-containing sensor histidine kinase [Chloroflexota bacterium]